MGAAPGRDPGDDDIGVAFLEDRPEVADPKAGGRRSNEAGDIVRVRARFGRVLLDRLTHTDGDITVPPEASERIRGVANRLHGLL